GAIDRAMIPVPVATSNTMDSLCSGILSMTQRTYWSLASVSWTSEKPRACFLNEDRTTSSCDLACIRRCWQISGLRREVSDLNLTTQRAGRDFRLMAGRSGPVGAGTLVHGGRRSAQRNQVAVLSDGFWRRRFGADPSIIGRALQLEGQGVTVVGVNTPIAFRPDSATGGHPE